MARRATDIAKLTITNFQEHDDVQWIKIHDSMVSLSRVLDENLSTSSSFSPSGDDRQKQLKDEMSHYINAQMAEAWQLQKNDGSLSCGKRGREVDSRPKF